MNSVKILPAVKKIIARGCEANLVMGNGARGLGADIGSAFDVWVFEKFGNNTMARKIDAVRDQLTLLGFRW